MDQRQHALVLGLGKSGLAAASLLLKKGMQVTAVDDALQVDTYLPEIDELLQRGMLWVSSSAIDSLDFDLFVPSPGVARTHSLYRCMQEAGIPIKGEIQIALECLHTPIIGVTGTNGKTTVTSLIEHVLKATGVAAVAAGNIGYPLASYAEEALSCKKQEVLVLELSSYQLETLHLPCLDAACVLNVSPDHLDRYNGIEEYAITKFHIFDCLKPKGQGLLYEKCLRDFPELLAGKRCYAYNCDSYPALFSIPPFDTLLSHDRENCIAAFFLCSFFGVTLSQFMIAYQSFKKPPHRIEFVCTIKDVTFIDDSKGTNVDAVVRAVESISGPVHLIAGGVDKGADYDCWISPFQGKVKAVWLIGSAADKIKHALENDFPVTICQDLSAAVQAAYAAAQPNETVLLSPGCASVDMFRDYTHRGQEFKRLVYALAKT